MNIAATLTISAIISFWIHHWGEQFLTQKGQRPMRIVIKGRQVHHSCFGAVAIIASFLVASAAVTVALIGFGIGNIWQHKRTHNAANEKGLVFISKLLK